MKKFKIEAYEQRKKVWIIEAETKEEAFEILVQTPDLTPDLDAHDSIEYIDTEEVIWMTTIHQ